MKHSHWYYLVFGGAIAIAFVYLSVTQNGQIPGLEAFNINLNISSPFDFRVTPSDGSVNRFVSVSDFEDFLSEYGNSDGSYYPEVFSTRSFAISESLDAVAAPGEASGFGGGGGTPDYSTTNVQEEGVDEGDIIKTDGEYLYVANGSTVEILDARPANEMAIIASIDLNATANQMYVQGDRLTVYGFQNSSYYPYTEDDVEFRIVPRRPITQSFVKVFDISEPSSPSLVRDFTFEGAPRDSRMIGDYLYFITTKYAYDIFSYPDPVPRVWENGDLIIGTPEVAERQPDLFYFSIPYEQPNVTTITAINVADENEEINPGVYITEANQQLYMSPDSLFLAYTQYFNEQDVVYDVSKQEILGRLSIQDRTRVSEIEQAPAYVLNDYEKQRKVMDILERYVYALPKVEREQLEKRVETLIRSRIRELIDELEKTIVHKFDIDGPDVTYVAQGEVPGHVINQFAMDEEGGYFRIATTRGRLWSQFLEDDDRQSYNNLYVLDDAMKQVGSVERLAMGEQIYSVRFMQNRAYMVTFEQVDPLFVIGLDDPRSPVVLGELKIPGFSNYLHPYDDTTLIGLGRDTEVIDDRVRTNGIKISMFDVGDVSNPVETTSFVIGDSSAYSNALDDHKAFLFSKDRNLLVIPIRGDYFVLRDFNEDLVPERDEAIFAPDITAAYVFDITPSTISLRGIVDHSNVDTEEQKYFYNTVKRSLYIDDVLYTLSDRYVKSSTLDTLDDLSTVSLPNNFEDRPYPEPIPLIEPFFDEGASEPGFIGETDASPPVEVEVVE